MRNVNTLALVLWHTPECGRLHIVKYINGDNFSKKSFYIHFMKDNLNKFIINPFKFYFYIKELNYNSKFQLLQYWTKQHFFTCPFEMSWHITICWVYSCHPIRNAPESFWKFCCFGRFCRKLCGYVLLLI